MCPIRNPDLKLNYEPMSNDEKLTKWFCCCRMNRENKYVLHTEAAPEPTDIIWGGHAISKRDRKWRQWGAFIIIWLSVSLAAFPIGYLMLWGDGLISARYGGTKMAALGFWGFLKVKLEFISCSVLITVFNKIIELVLVWCTDYTKPQTVTERESLIAGKLYKLQFINSA